MEYIIYNSETRQFSFIEDRYFAAKFLNEKQLATWLKANGFDPKMSYNKGIELYKQAAKDAGMSLSNYRSIALKQKGARNEAERKVDLQNRLHHVGEQKQLQNVASGSSNPAEIWKSGQEKLTEYHNALATLNPETGKSYGKEIKNKQVEATTQGNFIHKIDKAEKQVDRKYNLRETPGSKVIKAKKSKNTQSDFAKKVARSGKNKFRSKEVQDIRNKTEKSYNSNKSMDLGRTSGSSNARKTKNTFERQGAHKTEAVLNNNGPMTPDKAVAIKTSTEEKDLIRRGLSNDQKRKLKEAENSTKVTNSESNLQGTKKSTAVTGYTGPQSWNQSSPNKPKSKFGTGARVATGATAGAGIGAATTIGMKSRLMRKGYTEEEAAKKVRRAALIRSAVGAAAGAGIGAVAGYTKHRRL